MFTWIFKMQSEDAPTISVRKVTQARFWVFLPRSMTICGTTHYLTQIFRLLRGLEMGT